MQIKEVNSAKDSREFIEFAVAHYKNVDEWIRPIDKDIEGIFDPSRNKLFRDKKTTAKRWLLLDNGKIIGRIAAFVNGKTSFKGKLKAGGVGFFECIDDQNAADLLFDTAKEYLVENEMDAMDGPINLGERNAFWGLLVDGFDIEPVYHMNYNMPYYQKLFENYGFKIYFEQYSYGMKLYDPRPEKYIERQKNILADPKYKFTFVDKNNLSKYADDFYEIYNNAWGDHKGVPALQRKQAHAMMKQMKPVIVDYLMFFGYYDEKPIAVYLNLPELNQYFKHVNGKINWLGKLKILYHKLARTNHKFFGIVFGVVKEFQGKGVEAALIMAADKEIKKHPQWENIELTWIGDFNPKMMRVAENLGADIVKTHYTYRYLFDRSAPFERYPILR